MSGAEIDLKMDHDYKSSFWSDPTPQMLEILNRYDQKEKGYVFNMTFKYHEYILEVGDPISVFGEIVELDGEKVTYSKDTTPILVSEDSKVKFEKEIRFKSIVNMAISAGLLVLIGVLIFNYFS